jgi:hypothetical protein
VGIPDGVQEPGEGGDIPGQAFVENLFLEIVPDIGTQGLFVQNGGDLLDLCLNSLTKKD